jgi:hypothetical protein
MFATACKGKPAHREPPPNAVAATGSAKGSNAGPAAPDLELPRGDGTPPKKTTRKLVRADLEKLQLLEFPGFSKQPHGLTDNSMEVRQKTNDHPRLWATVTIEQCKDNCWPMDLAEWKKHEDALKKQSLGDFAAFASEIDWEMGMTQFHGQPLIYTYQLGLHKGGGEGGGIMNYTDSYILYFNDGVNQIRVIGKYSDDPVGTKAELAKVAPKDDLALLALSFLDVYTHAWPTS